MITQLLSYRTFAVVLLVLFSLVAVIPSSGVRGAPAAVTLTDIDGIAFSNPGQNGGRDIHSTGNNSGIRIYNADTLTNPPAGAAIQFFGNGHTGFPGQAYIDSGAHDSAAIIFRTARTGQGIGERMRIDADGRVGIGTNAPGARLDVRTTDLISIGAMNNATQGAGVFGVANGSDGTGVFGIANTGTNAAGVVGASSSGWAGLFFGPLGVSGNLVVSGNLNVSGTKSFVIDHPLDPANKYLYHAAVEGPERFTLYSGTVVTNAQGEATVQLPPYFEALNRDVRYQLTVIGEFAQAIVSSEVRNNQFTIKTDKPGIKVSWLVLGTRNDPYAQAHPFVAEQAKPKEEQGFYLQPDLYGQPANRGVAWTRWPETMQRMQELQRQQPSQR